MFTILKKDIESKVLTLNDDNLKKYFLDQKLSYDLSCIKYFDYKQYEGKNIDSNYFKNGVYFEYFYDKSGYVYKCNIDDNKINFIYVFNIKDIN